MNEHCILHFCFCIYSTDHCLTGREANPEEVKNNWLDRSSKFVEWRASITRADDCMWSSSSAFAIHSYICVCKVYICISHLFIYIASTVIMSVQMVTLENERVHRVTVHCIVRTQEEREREMIDSMIDSLHPHVYSTSSSVCVLVFLLYSLSPSSFWERGESNGKNVMCPVHSLLHVKQATRLRGFIYKNIYTTSKPRGNR